MKLKSVKFYQGVSLDGSVVTHAVANVPRVGTSYNGLKEVEITEVAHGVLLKKGNAATLATWNNVQYVEYTMPSDTDSVIEKEMAKRSK